MIVSARGLSILGVELSPGDGSVSIFAHIEAVACTVADAPLILIDWN